MHPNEVSAAAHDVSYTAVKLLSEAIDRRLAAIFSKSGTVEKVDARLLAWYLRFRTINLAEIEMMEDAERRQRLNGFATDETQASAEKCAEDLAILFRAIVRGEESTIPLSAGADPAAYEMVLQARDDAVTFLAERPRYLGVDQSYGGLIPAP